MAGVGWQSPKKRRLMVVQVQFKREKWSFANDISEDEPIVRWKENDEEKKMVCLVVVKVV